MIDSAVETMLLSEAMLARDWDTPEEDEAWKSLDQSWFWTPEWQAKEAEADESLRLGHFQTFATMDELIDALEPSARVIAAINELESGGGERFDSVDDLFVSWEDEAENDLLIESGVLPKLIEAALQTKLSDDWRSELAKVCSD